MIDEPLHQREGISQSINKKKLLKKTNFMAPFMDGVQLPQG